MLNNVSVIGSTVRGYTKVGILHGFTQAKDGSNGSFAANHCSIVDSHSILEADGTDPEAGPAAVIVGYDGNNLAKTNGIRIENSDCTVDSSVKWNYEQKISSTGVPYYDAYGGQYTLNCDTYIKGNGVEAVQFVAEVDGYQYETLEDAINAAPAGGTITLLRDFTNDSYVSVDKNLTIDFAGHTVNSNAGGIDLSYINPGTELVLKNGVLNTEKWGVWVQNAGKLTVESDMAVNAISETNDQSPAIVVVEKDSIANIYGTVTAKASTAVSGNGNSGSGDVSINIFYGATVKSDSCAAIYFPNTGSLNISGGSITGDVGVQLCAGSLNLSGSPVIEATGINRVSEKTGDGDIPDGAAISLVNRPGYVGVPSASISGSPTVNSVNGTAAVTAYTWNASEAKQEPWSESKDNLSITGGTFTANGLRSDVAPYYDSAKYYQDDAGTVLPASVPDLDKDVVVVVPDENVAAVPDETVKAAADQAESAANDLEGGKTPVGMTDEQAAEAKKVMDQVDAGGTVNTVVLLKAQPKTESDVPADVEAVNELKTNGESITALYDISAAIQIVVEKSDGTVVRSSEFSLSEVGQALQFELKVDPALIVGKAVRVAHVHDGVASIVAPVSVDREAGVIVVDASKFSIFSVLTSGECAVSFDSNQGTSVASQAVAYGKLATEPAAPTRDGYVFKGWFESADFSGEAFDFENTPITANVALYAKWAKLHTVTFDKCVLGQNNVSESVEDGTAVDNPGTPGPLPAGYAFKGWFTSSNGGSLYDFDAPVAGNVTLYAQIEKDESQKQETVYTVKHVVKGAPGEEDVVRETVTVGSEAWVGESNPKIEITADSIADRDYTGYKVSSVSPNVTAGDEVASGSVVTVTYVKDEAATKTLSYSVKHVLDGVEKTEDTLEYKESVWVNETRTTTPVQEGSLGKQYVGYDFVGYYVDGVKAELTVGSDVADGSVVEARYSADFSNIEAKGVEKIYDGTSASVVVTGALPDDAIAYEVAGAASENIFTNVADSADVVVKVTRGAKTESFDCAVKISPAEAVISAKSASKVFDGAPLTETGFEVSGFVGDEGVESAVIEGSQTEVGTSANKVTDWTPKANTIPANYNVTFVDGVLEVTAAPVVPENPGTSGGNGSGGNATAPSADKPASGTVSTAKTGDEAPMAPLVALAVGSALITLAAVAMRRRSE